MATYKKWFKEVYPFEELSENYYQVTVRDYGMWCQDNFEDLIWKSRAVLDKKELAVSCTGNGECASVTGAGRQGSGK